MAKEIKHPTVKLKAKKAAKPKKGSIQAILLAAKEFRKHNVDLSYIQR